MVNAQWCYATMGEMPTEAEPHKKKYSGEWTSWIFCRTQSCRLLLLSSFVHTWLASNDVRSNAARSEEIKWIYNSLKHLIATRIVIIRSAHLLRGNFISCHCRQVKRQTLWRAFEHRLRHSESKRLERKVLIAEWEKFGLIIIIIPDSFVLLPIRLRQRRNARREKGRNS